MEKVIQLLEEGVKNGVYPGGVIAIGNKEGEFFRHAVGDATFDGVYDIASLTKVVSTTMITLQFIQDGKLSLYDKLQDFFESVPSNMTQITILDLMTHRSGLPAFHDLATLTNQPNEVVEAIFHKGLVYETNQDVIYSCMGFIVLGRILEHVGKAPLNELFEIYVAKPLNLSETGYALEGVNFVPTSKDLAPGFIHDPNARYLNSVSGNAGLFSTLSDLSRVTCMLANRGEFENLTYIHPTLFESTLVNYSPKGCEPRGIGFSLKGEDVCPCGDLFDFGSYGHTGFTGTSLWVDSKTGTYVVFLTNRVYESDMNTKIIRFRRLLHNCIMNELRWG